MKKKSFEKIKYELSFFIIFVAEMIISVPAFNQMREWRTSQYGVTYEFGFVQMGFVGTVFKLFCNILTEKILWTATVIALIILSFMMSIILTEIVKKSDKSIFSGVCAIVILYMVSPLSVAKFFNARNFATFDIYLMIILIACAVFALKEKTLWLLLPLSVLALLVHYVFAFTYYMFIFGVLLYYAVKNKESKKYFIFFALTVFISVGVFSYFYFFGNTVPFKSETEMADYIKKTNTIPIVSTVYIRYFMGSGDFFDNTILTGMNGVTENLLTRFLGFVVTMVVLWPVVALFIMLWTKTIKKCEDKNEKLIYLFILISPLFAVPIFVTGMDWDRWMMGIFCAQILFVFFLIKKNEQPFISALTEVSHFLSNHKLIFYIYIIILAMLRLSPIEYSFSELGSEIISYGFN